MCLPKLSGTILSCHCEIDIRILTLRAIYFFQTTAGSSISRFLIVFLNKYFNAQQLGILLGVRPGVGFFSSFIWGFIGDWTQRHLLCLISGLVISTIAINGLVFNIIGTNFWYSMALLNIVTIFGASGCLFDAIVLLILGEKKDVDNDEDIENENENIEPDQSEPVEEEDEYDEDEEESGTKEYGATRLWGALGWGLGALICGTLLAQFGEDYLFWFYDVTYSIPIIIMIVASSYLTIKKSDHNDDDGAEIVKNELLETPIASDMISSPPQFHKGSPRQNGADHEEQVEKKMDTKMFRKNVCTLYGVIFLGNLLLFGTCMAFVENYLFLFLLDKFNATTVLCGLTIGMMVLGEVPIFYCSKWFLDKIGIIGLLSLAHFAYVIRCIGYTLLPQTRYYSWFILFIEPLHGLTFGGMWIASVEYGSKLAPESMQGTMQGLIGGIYQGLASCFGTVIGGIIYHHFGPVFMYRLSAAIICGWMILFQISLRIIRLCHPSDGIKLIFGERIKRKESRLDLKAKLLNKSMAEAPRSSLLVDDDIMVNTDENQLIVNN